MMIIIIIIIVIIDWIYCVIIPFYSSTWPQTSIILNAEHTHTVSFGVCARFFPVLYEFFCMQNVYCEA